MTGFLTCDDINAAVARAFDKWSANSRFIKFLDVTNECELAGTNYGPPFRERQSGPYPHGGCQLAEIWITFYVPPSPPSGRRLQDSNLSGDLQIEGVAEELGGATAVATARPHARYSSDFRFTNGARPFYNSNSPQRGQPRPIVETYAGTFTFNTGREVCWYMDSEFCAPFHRLKVIMNGPANARLFVMGLTY